ncbi:MAG TPA: molybdopterin molybdotransferase MoeA [Woeseiaceae bacterium]|nr:molybdopterin molybdotransferase MoeA [Woeseiaceae bacterium]|tara:strand:+ start:16640 stop:17848 length:1209 start_codon:yes stop_codon:yes gene_type:complete
MITSKFAVQLISENLPILTKKKIDTHQSIGCILKEPIKAERDQPPFNRVTMDGIAINFDSLREYKLDFPIEATQFAGDPQKTLTNKNYCIEIMTGSALPKGTNCVIPIEEIVIKNDIAHIQKNYKAIKHQFIHAQGSDYKEGSVVLKVGKKIEPIDIALILSCGKEELTISSEPIIRIISTGSELVPVGGKILSHQVRMSNGPSIKGMLYQQGFENCQHKHLIDDKTIQKNSIKNHLHSSDILILSGGISMGKADYIPTILNELSVRCIFYKVKQRPGKPMWFGVGPRKQLVFALPGNPVSAITCCRHYIIPALHKMRGHTHFFDEYVQLQKNINFKPNLTYFLPVKITHQKNAITKALPVETNTSGDFSSLSKTEGYIELNNRKSNFRKNENIKFHRWKHP